jgi:hypothetical protein
VRVKARRVRTAGAAVAAEPKTVAMPSMPPTAVRIAFRAGPDGQAIEFSREVP